MGRMYMYVHVHIPLHINDLPQEILGRAIEKCHRLLVEHWIIIAYAVSCCLLP